MGREHKANADIVETRLRFLGRHIEFDAQFCDHIRTAGAAGGRAIAMFSNGHARAGYDESGRGRDVERLNLTSTGAGGVL